MQLHGIKAEDALLTSGPEIIEWEQTRKEFTCSIRLLRKYYHSRELWVLDLFLIINVSAVAHYN